GWQLAFLRLCGRWRGVRRAIGVRGGFELPCGRFRCDALPFDGETALVPVPKAPREKPRHGVPDVMHGGSRAAVWHLRHGAAHSGYTRSRARHGAGSVQKSCLSVEAVSLLHGAPSTGRWRSPVLSNGLRACLRECRGFPLERILRLGSKRIFPVACLSAPCE